MKHELIKTENYLFVVDNSEIKEGDIYIRVDNGILFATLKNSNPEIVKKHCKKIIAHLPLNNLPIFGKVPLLPSLEIEDDVEQMAKDKWRKMGNTGEVTWGFKDGYKCGYNKAKESERNNLTPFKNLITLIENGLLKGAVETNLIIDQEISICKEHLNKLSQPNTPTPTHFEFEMDKDYRYNDDGEPIGFKVHDSNKIKTITNEQGQEVVCGKYIYE